MHRRHCLATAAGLAWPATTTLAQPAPAGHDPALAGLLEQRLRDSGGVGLGAAVVDGASLRLAGAGRRSAAVPTPPDADTPFEIGSITKTFTGLLLAEMVLRRELALDEPVQAVLPQGLKLQDSAGAPLTWADLATHRSGLPRLPDNLRDPSGADPYDYTREELWRFVAGWKPTQRRDTAWAYSNLGYGLLAEALALRAGLRYEALLRERVLMPLGLPLGLPGLQLALRQPPLPGLLPGHDAEGRAVPNWRFDAMAGAGALVGSVRALARYAQAALGLFEHPLQPAFELAMRPHGQGPGPNNPVGLGWLIGPLNGRRVFNHDGATAGYASSLFIDPTRRRAALVLANAQVPVNDLGLHLLDETVPLRNLAAERGAARREAVALPAEALAPLPGRYALSPQFGLEIRVRQGRVFAQATGQGEFELFALGPRRFFARVTPLEMVFEGAEGVPPALVLEQSGQRLRFVRE